MILEVNDIVREQFAEEAVNISVQFRRLLKQHDRKLRNMMKEYKVIMIVLSVLLILYITSMLTWMIPDGFTWAACIVLAFGIIIYYFAIRNLNRTYWGIMDQKRGSVITLDENGAELNRHNAQILRMSWDNIAFVRVFKESLCFFSKEANGMIILVDVKYADTIVSWLKENRPDTEMVL